MTRRRAIVLAVIALAWAAATVAWAKLRLPARTLVRGHLGDVAATMFVYAILSLAFPRSRMRWRATITLAIAFGMELGQLVWSTSSTAGELVLGNVFDWWDLVAYVGGVAIALVYELTARPTRSTPAPGAGAPAASRATGPS